MTAQDLINQFPDGTARKKITFYWILGSVALTFTSAVFGAGIGYELIKTQYIDKISEDSKYIDQINAGLQQINNGYSYRNMLTSNGPGDDPSFSPGRCPINEVVVGIQPWPGGFRMQCGKMPVLQKP